MKSETLTHLSDQELAQELKNRKSGFIFMSIVISILIIIAIMDTIKDGLNYFTFFPLFFIPMAFVKLTKFKAAQKETAIRQSK